MSKDRSKPSSSALTYKRRAEQAEEDADAHD